MRTVHAQIKLRMRAVCSERAQFENIISAIFHFQQRTGNIYLYHAEIAQYVSSKRQDFSCLSSLVSN